MTTTNDPQQQQTAGEVETTTRGWAFPNGSRRAHYFVATMSLCRKWGLYFGPVHDDNHGSPDNCSECMRKRHKLVAHA